MSPPHLMFGWASITRSLGSLSSRADFLQMGGNQPGNQNANSGQQTGNKRKRLNDGSDARQQQQQQQQHYNAQQQLFANDPSLQTRYAGLSQSGYRATPGVNSSLQPT